MAGQGRTTLADVAKEARVSTATVSRALATDPRPDVSEETRRRIRAIATRLGYQPNTLAQSLRSGGFRGLSVVLPEDYWGWWEPTVLCAADTARAHDYHLLMHPIRGVGRDLVAVLSSLRQTPTEGALIIAPDVSERARAALSMLDLHYVLLDDASDDPLGPTVCARNYDGARRMTEYLIERGRRAIVYYAPDAGARFLRERHAGYTDAVVAAGLRPTVVFDPDAIDESRRYCEPIAAQLPPEGGADAIFCAMDLLAPAVLRTVRRAGLRVPDDVAVAGFDDERVALLVDPPLTTVRQPLGALGSTAIDMLIGRIEGRLPVDDRIELDTEIVIRASA